jgi:hypothetical protein
MRIKEKGEGWRGRLICDARRSARPRLAGWSSRRERGTGMATKREKKKEEGPGRGQG